VADLGWADDGTDRLWSSDRCGASVEMAGASGRAASWC